MTNAWKKNGLVYCSFLYIQRKTFSETTYIGMKDWRREGQAGTIYNQPAATTSRKPITISKTKYELNKQTYLWIPPGDWEMQEKESCLRRSVKTKIKTQIILHSYLSSGTIFPKDNPHTFLSFFKSATSLRSELRDCNRPVWEGLSPSWWYSTACWGTW